MANNSPYLYGDVKLGRGSFELPPVLIGTLFYRDETIVERNNPENFNRDKAKKRIDMQKELGKKYKIPEMIEISGNSPESTIKYLDFYLDNYEPPFVLGGTFDARIAAMDHLKERGYKPEDYIYNAISNLKNKKELEMLKKYKVSSIVVLMLASENMTSTQRFAYITEKNQPDNQNIIEGLKKIGIEQILIDGGVITLESLAHILETQQIISTSYQFPVGTAPNLFLFKYSSPRLNVKFLTRYRRASIMFAATWFSNFLFYGAIEDAKECFASARQAMDFKAIVREKNIKIF